MLSLKRLTSFAAACLVLSCEPVDRDYGEYAAIEASVTYPSPTVVATGSPPFAPCACVPVCGAKPLLTGGASGCEPTLAGAGSISMNVPTTKAFVVIASGAPAASISEDGAVFSKLVRARGFAGPNSRIAYGPDASLSPNDHTLRLQPGNTQTLLHLPLAASVAGQRFVVKIIGSDANVVTFDPAVDPATGLMDNMVDVDGDAILQTSGGNPAITIEAYDDTDGQDGPDQPGWIVIGR